MKTRIFLTTILALLLSTHGWTKPVDAETARQLAGKFLSNHGDQSSQRSVRSLSPQGIQSGLTSTLKRVLPDGSYQVEGQDYPAFHVFQLDSGGFVIIAGDDIAHPVLGYSTENTLDSSQLPPSLETWLNIYRDQISSAVQAGVTRTPMIAKEWELLAFNGLSTQHALSVGSLVSTTWGQAPYYNEKCPFDTTEQERTVAGCVATAMAQIMKYWEYPATGKGHSQYQHSTYGMLSVEYGDTSYDWGNMPEYLSALSSTLEKDAISTLMYHCGVSVQMDYGVDDSGSSVSAIPRALSSYFDYAPSLSVMKKDETTNSLWLYALKNELDNQRPVIYIGYLSDGAEGHAWVCDGYDNDDFFHMNWGWEGYGDGYYSLAALEPLEGYTFSDYQAAVVGIRPGETEETSTLKIYGSIAVAPNPIVCEEPFAVAFNVENQSNQSFAGTISISIYDENNNFLYSIGTLWEDDLPAGYHYSDSVMLNHSGAWIMPGNYNLVIQYKKELSDLWEKAMGTASQPNWVAFPVASAAADISLYAPITIGNNATIRQNTPFNLSLNVMNSGISPFTGVIELDFYTLDGDYCADVPSIFHYDVSNLQPNQHYDVNLSTVVAGVDIAPGEYLVGLTYYAQNGSSWELGNQGLYSNPVRVLVQPGPDRYEPNDDSFVVIQPVFTDDRADQIIDSATIHSNEDVDQYFIQLEPGYDYELNARVHDSVNSGTGETYTADVFWLLVTSGGFVDFYDDIMDKPQTIYNGGYAVIGVMGFGANLGTYDFEFIITRRPTGSAPDANNPRLYTIPLYRFHRSDTDTYFFTANEAEKNNILANANPEVWTMEKVSQHVLSTQVPNSAPVYRLHRNATGGFFYTISEAEVELIKHDFTVDGIAFYALTSPVYDALPVYRFCDQETGARFYTIGEVEKNQIIATIPKSHLVYEGIAWYAYP